MLTGSIAAKCRNGRGPVASPTFHFAALLVGLADLFRRVQGPGGRSLAASSSPSSSDSVGRWQSRPGPRMLDDVGPSSTSGCGRSRLGASECRRIRLLVTNPGKGTRQCPSKVRVARPIGRVRLYDAFDLARFSISKASQMVMPKADHPQVAETVASASDTSSRTSRLRQGRFGAWGSTLPAKKGPTLPNV
jgi:hypothetical protein